MANVQNAPHVKLEEQYDYINEKFLVEKDNDLATKKYVDDNTLTAGDNITIVDDVIDTKRKVELTDITIADGASAIKIITTAGGKQAVAEGVGTTASGDYSHAGGKYNIEDITGTYAVIVGNGTDNSSRSNAYTLDWQGNEVLAGKITANGVINGSLFFGLPITTTTLSGNATWTIEDLKTMMRVVLSGSTNTITLPNGGENLFRFQLIVAQDSTGSRALTISGVSGVNVYNTSEFDFSGGGANQICVCTIIWDGTEYIYECTNYVGGE